MGDEQPLVLSHLFMVVTDLERARRFYVDEVGLELLVEEPGYLRLGLGSIRIGMEQGPPEKVGAPGIELELHVDDVDLAYAELLARGVWFTAPPADMPWGNRHAFFTDPDGYAWSIWSERKSAI
jgi:catechol 2,3-dioxygenase-like lactoylglutathione lyase family enzyme